MKARKRKSSEYFWQSLLLTAILLLTFALRIYRLDYQSLRGDEAVSAVYSAMPVPEMIAVSLADEPHPPLFYLILHGWGNMFGANEFMLRFWAVMPGFLAVASLFTLVKQTIGRKTGLVAAGLLAINSFHIQISQDARSYALLVLWGVWSSFFLWQMLRKEKRRYCLAYALTMTGLFYLHYYALFIAVFHALFTAWRVWQNRAQRKQKMFCWGASMAIAGLAVTPWLALHWQYALQYKGNFPPASLAEMLWRGFQAFNGGIIFETPQPSLWALLPTLLVFTGIGSLRRSKTDATLFYLLYLTTTFAGIALLSLRGQAFTERYLVAALPVWLIFTAFGWQQLAHLKIPFNLLSGIAATLFILILNANAWFHYQFDDSLAKSPPWREVLNYIAKKSKPGDALIFTAPLPTITYYNANRLPAHLVPYSVETTPKEMEADLEAFLQKYNRLWLLPTKGLTPVAEQVKPWLDKHAIRVDQTFFRILHTNLYESPAYFLNTITPQPVLFAESIHLDGFRFEKGGSFPQKIKPGKTLNLTLVWHTDAPVGANYTVFTHLAGPDGALYGQWDNPPGRGTWPTTQWLPGEQIFDSYQIPVQENAPPGEYRLFVGMYNSATGERLPVLDEAGNPIADHAVLSIPLVVEY